MSTANNTQSASFKNPGIEWRNIVRILTDRGVPEKEVAKVIADAVGWTPQRIYAYSSGARASMRDDTLRPIAEALGVTLLELKRTDWIEGGDSGLDTTREQHYLKTIDRLYSEIDELKAEVAYCRRQLEQGGGQPQAPAMNRGQKKSAK